MKTQIVRHGELVLKPVAALPKEAEKNPSASAMQAMLCDLTLEEYMGMSLES